MTKYFVTISKYSLWIREAEKVTDNTVDVVEIDKQVFDFLMSVLKFRRVTITGDKLYTWVDYGR